MNKESIISYKSDVIGKIGIDNIKLCNLFNPQDISLEEMNLAISGMEGVISTKNKTTLSGENFRFSYGINGKRPFYDLEISASNHGEPNLTNMSLEDVTAKLLKIQDYLLDCGVIPTTFAHDLIRVSSIEINRTIPLACPYAEYEHILLLLSKYACTSEKDYIMPVTYPKTGKTETIYTRQKKEKKQVKLYDKSSHLFDVFHYKTDTDYLRCELTATEQALSLVKMVNDPNDAKSKIFRLCDLTDEKLNGFYLNTIGKIFRDFDSKMPEKVDLTMSKKASDPMLLIIQSILTSALDNNAQGICRSLLELFVKNELFLDYKDIYTSLDASDFHESIVSALRAGFSYIETHGDITGTAEKLFNQREKYTELKDKLLGPSKYSVAILPNFILLPGNPRHVEVQKPSESMLGIAYPKEHPQYEYEYYYDVAEKRIRYRFRNPSKIEENLLSA